MKTGEITYLWNLFRNVFKTGFEDQKATSMENACPYKKSEHFFS